MRFPKVIFGLPVVLVVGLFFLSWVSVTAINSSTEVLTVNGLNLALGNITAEFGPFTGEVPVGTGDYELFLIPAFALLALALVFISDRLLKGLYVGACGVALMVWALYWWQIETDLRPLFVELTRTGTPLSLTYQIAFWAVGGLLVLLMLMGILFDNKGK